MTVAHIDSGDDETLYVDVSENRDRSILKRIVRHGYCDIRPLRESYVKIYFSSTYYGGELHGQPFKLCTELEKPLEFSFENEDTYEIFLTTVPEMKLGEKCNLIIAPNVLYDESPALKFQVELLCIKDDCSSHLARSVGLRWTKRMPWPRRASLGYSVTIKYRCVNPDQSHEFRELTYILGDTTSSGVPKFVDMAVQRLREGEWGIVNHIIPGQFLMRNNWYGENAYEVTLIKAEPFNSDLSSLCNPELESSVAETIKFKANEYLKNGHYSLAILMYEALLGELRLLKDKYGEEPKNEEMKVAVLLNLALAHLKNNEASKCIARCDEILIRDGHNEKALFRMGQAYLLRDDLKGAEEYFKQILALNPNNIAAANAIKKYEQYKQEQDLTLKNQMRNVVNILKQTGFGSERDIETGDNLIT